MAAPINFEVYMSFEAGQAPGSDYIHTVYDSVTGLPQNVTSVTPTGQHADLAGGKWSVTVENSLSYGRLKFHIDNSVAANNELERWAIWNYTADGVAYTNGGASFYIYTRLEETIDTTGGITVTMTQDLPVSANCTHLTVKGTGVVETAGFKINFDATKPLIGEVRVKSTVTIRHTGGTTGNKYFVNVSKVKGNGHVVIEDGALYDNAEGIASVDLSYQSGGYKRSGYVICGAKVNSNSLIPEVDDNLVSYPQLFVKGLNNPMVPSKVTPAFWNRKGYIQLDGGMEFECNGFQHGLRCGVLVSNGVMIIGQMQYHCISPGPTSSQVANVTATATQWRFKDTNSWAILSGGEWTWRAFSENGQLSAATDGKIIMALCTSHAQFDCGGSGKVRGVIMIGSDEPDVAGENGRVLARVTGVEVLHCLFIGNTGDTYLAPLCAIGDGYTAKYNYNIEVGHRCDRGPGVAIDGAVMPCNGAGTGQQSATLVGGKYVPATGTTQRLLEAKGNVRTGGQSTGGDVYTAYGVDVTTGTLGQDDLNATDPQLTSVYDHVAFRNDLNAVLAGSKTSQQMYNAIIAACTPLNAALSAVPTDGTIPGPLPLGTVSNPKLLLKQMDNLSLSGGLL